MDKETKRNPSMASAKMPKNRQNAQGSKPFSAARLSLLKSYSKGRRSTPPHMSPIPQGTTCRGFLMPADACHSHVRHGLDIRSDIHIRDGVSPILALFSSKLKENRNFLKKSARIGDTPSRICMSERMSRPCPTWL